MKKNNFQDSEYYITASKYGEPINLTKDDPLSSMCETYSNGLIKTLLKISFPEYSKEETSEKFVGVGFIKDPDLNARVVKSRNGGHWIILNTGVMTGLTFVFSRLFRSREFLPDIGDVSKEELNVESIGIQMNHHDYYTNHKLIGSVEIKKPIDSVRRMFYRACMLNAIAILFYHEMGHIIFNHLDMLYNLNVEYLNEQSTELSNKSKIRHNCELECDKFSAYSMWQNWTLYGTFIPGIKPLLENLELSVRSYFISLTVMYWVLHSYPYFDLDIYDLRSHPHPDVRLFGSFSQAQMYVAISEDKAISKDCPFFNDKDIRLLNEVLPKAQSELDVVREYFTNMYFKDIKLPRFEYNYVKELSKRLHLEQF